MTHFGCALGCLSQFSSPCAYPLYRYWENKIQKYPMRFEVVYIPSNWMLWIDEDGKSSEVVHIVVE